MFQPALRIRTGLALLLALAIGASGAFAAPDQYIGDSAIYGYSSAVGLRPNVLLIIDNSNRASETASGVAYDPATLYPNQGYNSWGIYAADQQGDFPANKQAVASGTSALEGLLCTANGNIIQNTLLANGTYVGAGTAGYPNIKNSDCDTGPSGKTYALGNFLNYTLAPAAAGAQSQMNVVYQAIEDVVGGARFAVNFGAMVYGDNNKGGKVVSQVADLSSDAALSGFLSTLPGGSPGALLLSSQTARPQAEALLDAGYYFRGEALPISGQSAMNSPITKSCDKNFVIFITNGLSNKDDDPKLATLVGDLDGDGAESAAYGLGTHYLDDVAKKIYEQDAIGDDDLDGVQSVITHMVLAFQSDDPLVERTADASHGRGSYHNVSSTNELTAALSRILVGIVLESDSSFVAPVVPTSPENRTYSGERVYLGFFKPVSQKPWHGNLKKYGLNGDTEIIDKNNILATLSDGSFTNSATSYWSSNADSGQVEEGGTGNLLLTRDFSINPRKIYSNLGAETDLTQSANAFTAANLSAAALGVANDATRDLLVNYIYGYDSLDEDGDGTVGSPANGEKRSWILGDILHSKPAVISYARFTFNQINEADCSLNKSMIYVGTNDGMLHAFRDCDGEEAWAFIPDAVLPNLKELIARPALHSYFVDSTPVPYIFDSDNDGNIGAAEAADADADNGAGDRVILYLGLRRGGNAYYALDVTDPAVPKFLWKLDPGTSGFGELAQSWSEPSLGKVQHNDGSGVKNKIVAFIGAGYDNANEDRRFGATPYFTGDTAAAPGNAEGAATSPGDENTPAVNPKGRGVFAFEVATLGNGAPTIATSPTLVWSHTYASGDFNRQKQRYSIPSEVTVLDTDFDGYSDRLYVGDTGAQMWRYARHESGGALLPLADKLINNWTGKRIFTAGENPLSDLDAADSEGRKIFYRPSVTYESDYIALYFGTGDRVHPLNRAVTDRMYSLLDRGQRTNQYIGDDNLVDVTENLLQEDSTSAADVAALLAGLSSSSNYGWRIDLDRLNEDSLHAGEKILAPGVVFNKVAYFTSYTPNTDVSVDVCTPGNLGISRLYALNYKTGESVLNFDQTNDSAPGGSTSERALNADDKMLRRADRSVDLGVGIPSGIVIVLPPDGDAKILIGSGGGLLTEDPTEGGTLFPIYWQQW